MFIVVFKLSHSTISCCKFWKKCILTQEFMLCETQKLWKIRPTLTYFTTIPYATLCRFRSKSLGFKDRELKNHSDTYLLTLLSWFSNLFIAVFNAIINASARNDLTRAAVRRSAQAWYNGVNATFRALTFKFYNVWLDIFHILDRAILL